jgi:hypothetical protein
MRDSPSARVVLLIIAAVAVLLVLSSKQTQGHDVASVLRSVRSVWWSVGTPKPAAAGELSARATVTSVADTGRLLSVFGVIVTVRRVLLVALAGAAKEAAAAAAEAGVSVSVSRCVCASTLQTTMSSPPRRCIHRAVASAALRSGLPRCVS